MHPKHSYGKGKIYIQIRCGNLLKKKAGFMAKQQLCNVTDHHHESFSILQEQSV
jgi:hypothetical protein